jgi:hypothetical protein
MILIVVHVLEPSALALHGAAARRHDEHLTQGMALTQRSANVHAADETVLA